MLTYSLMFSNNGCLVDGEDYTNLDEARDIAFNISETLGLPVSICEEYGISSQVIETYGA
jgi:hypothetical protein